ncbi:MAG: Arylsulfotransferase [Acidimicrobiales bacterium]|nr:Arylsulfotransferase [Acidimicrobiales bacterium]
MSAFSGRQLFALVATGLIAVAGVVMVAWPSSSGGATNPLRTFLSRPDLHPPAVTVTKQANSVGPDHVFLTLAGPLIVDNKGEPVWYLPLQGMGSADLRVQEYRGQPVLTWWEGKNEPTFGEGDWVIADTSYREIRRIHAGNGYAADLHDLLLTPQGTALVTAYAPATADLRPVGGPAGGPITDSIVQEVDVETGRVLFEWHASDHVALDESHTQFSAGSSFDFFHVNSIDVDHDGNLLVSARNTWALYKIDRTSGAVLWRLAGKKSDFALGAGVPFAWQHDARRQADGTITLFDDEAAPQIASQSRGLVLRVDEPTRTASLVRQYTRNLLASSQGDTQLLPNGNALIGWGSLPNVSEFSPDGKLLFDARFPQTMQSYRAFRLPWHGRPTDPPSIAAVHRGDGQLIVYASWNGATDVARWEVLGGSTAQNLRPLSSTERTGFETAVATTAPPAVVAARALDAAGHELGRSAPVAIRAG